MSLVIIRRTLTLGLVALACVAAGRPMRAADGPYHFTSRIRLGVPAAVHVFDPSNGRLYSSAPSFPRGVFVMNTAQPGISDRLGETPFGPIDVAPDRNELFVLSPTEHRLRVVDLSTRRVVHTFDAPVGDAVFYEPTRQDVYVLGTDHKTITVLAAKNGQQLGTMKLKGEPSFILADPATKRVYVRLIDEKAIQVIDPTERAIVASWPVDTFARSTMAVDPGAHHLFVSSADFVWMLDTITGERLAKIDLEHHVLGLACDPATGMVMASTPIGLVVARTDAMSMTPVQTVSVGMNSSFLFFDPRSHNVFAVGLETDQLPGDGTLVPQQSAMLTFERK